MGCVYPRFGVLFLTIGTSLYAQNAASSPAVHIWEMHEITLRAERQYENCDTAVTCRVELEGPRFSQRIYGF